MKIQRRTFLRAAIGGAALMPASTFFLPKSASGATSVSQLSTGDIGVITVGLNNEYLEAEFYLRALTGKGLPAQDTTGAGSHGTVMVNTTHPVTFSNRVIQSIAQQLANDELAHVLDIRATFASNGLTPPAEPMIDFVNSFQLLATQAGLNRHFNPLGSETDFLLAAFFFEENDSPLLVGAMGGLASSALTPALASLLGDEAAHSGFIRLGLGEQRAAIIAEANKIAQLKQKLAASSTVVFQQLVNNGMLMLSPIGANATVVPLAPQQYFNNVFLSVNAQAGGFFPNGLNLA
jgi:Ferritin-like domain